MCSAESRSFLFSVFLIYCTTIDAIFKLFRGIYKKYGSGYKIFACILCILRIDRRNRKQDDMNWIRA